MSTDQAVPPNISAPGHQRHSLKARRLGIATAQQEPTVFMREDCFVCRSEGLASRPQVLVAADGREIVATLFTTKGDFLAPGEIGFSELAWGQLGIAPGEEVTVSHPPPIASLGYVRSRIYGNRIEESAFRSIVTDIVAGRYNDVHLAAFVTACSAFPLDQPEMVGLTKAMVEVGDRLSWPHVIVLDKHSVGGLPGNRTTPIVVAIVAAHGLIMPKTSSRAITSPAGTADTMETLAPVELNLAAMRRVVEQEGGCVAWGGSIRLSPADEMIIGVERVLDLDTAGQLVASVLSKKIAAGATHLLVDMPVGPTAKVRTPEAAALLSKALISVAEDFGVKAQVMVGDGDQPIGRGIGPALEAYDVLAVLQGRDPPQDLKARACELAGALLEMGGCAPAGRGTAMAEASLADGRAWAKFQRICEAQGGMRTPPVSSHRHILPAPRGGKLVAVDNRKLAKLAKLAGAPAAKAAGVEMHVRIGMALQAGDPLCTVHAETPGELEYAIAFAGLDGTTFHIGES
jgi:thymidine phosphorylase